MLSTFHANDSVTAIPRFLKMGIEPFLLSSTLELLIGQRLVRRICDSCRVSYEATTNDLKVAGVDLSSYLKKGETLYRGKGCVACGQTGYRGRMGVFEFLPVDSEIQKIILDNPASNEIWPLAKKQGAITMFEDGLSKVRSGITTPEELLRVVSLPK